MTATVHTLDTVPAQTRGTLHSVAGAVIAVLIVYGFVNDAQAAAVGAAVVAALDLGLVLVYTRAAWRKALYPVLYAAGAVLAVYGVVSQNELGAILGVAAAVLGTQVAAQNTPTVSGRAAHAPLAA